MVRGRRSRVLAAVVALAGVLAGAWLLSGPRPCRETFDRVRVGMTRAEVAAAVGGPPGDYGRGESWWGGYGTKFMGYDGWLGPDAALMVRFDAAGRADDVAVVAVLEFPRAPGVWDRVRRRVGL